MTALRHLVVALSLTTLAACSGSSGAPDAGTDAGPADAGVPYDTTCSMPGTPGNELGVGKFCANSNDCYSTSPTFEASFCTTLQPPVSQWFCTFPCTCDAQCGTGAICTSGTSDGGGRAGCVPIVCAGGQTTGNACYADGGRVH